ncbi:hypothetical protein [Peribacillus frigoritolerans]|uniref:hypothetical protein n=1 Tax=Peribacillus frigoritolerans TaxID=450367 RepID=UPI002E20B7F2|nr:hypothetical protein [Peribacillus frigoritolerans]MED3845711.1 hypothetical protein [Peribacillus frigoritolerans]
MKPEILSTAIETLTDLFFRKNNGTDFLALRTTELYINLDLLGDTNAVASEIERQRAYALVPKLRLFDNKSADEIEAVLHWSGLTEAEIIASEKVFEEWKRKQL